MMDILNKCIDSKKGEIHKRIPISTPVTEGLNDDEKIEQVTSSNVNPSCQGRSNVAGKGDEIQLVCKHIFLDLKYRINNQQMTLREKPRNVISQSIAKEE